EALLELSEHVPAARGVPGRAAAVVAGLEDDRPQLPLRHHGLGAPILGVSEERPRAARRLGPVTLPPTLQLQPVRRARGLPRNEETLSLALEVVAVVAMEEEGGEAALQIGELPLLDRLDQRVQRGARADLSMPTDILVGAYEIPHAVGVEGEPHLRPVDGERLEAERVGAFGLEARSERDRHPLHPVVAPARGDQEVAVPSAIDRTLRAARPADEANPPRRTLVRERRRIARDLACH